MTHGWTADILKSITFMAFYANFLNVSLLATTIPKTPFDSLGRCVLHNSSCLLPKWLSVATLITLFVHSLLFPGVCAIFLHKCDFFFFTSKARLSVNVMIARCIHYHRVNFKTIIFLMLN